jgi:hypothetical protein
LHEQVGTASSHAWLEVAGNLQPPLQDSIEQVKAAATEAATQTADQAMSAAAGVKEPLRW